MQIDQAVVEPYYRAAVLGLRAFAARTGRSGAFGPEAEARWKAFRGALGDGDRIDLLLRAAARGNPAAFAPRLILPIDGLTDDEPFGPDWPEVPPRLAAELAKEFASPPADAPPVVTLTQVAKAWGLAAAPFAPPELERVGPATRLVAAGASATLALAGRFDAHAELDLSQQVLFVATTPGERHLAGLAVALVSGRGGAQVTVGGAPLDPDRRTAFSRPSALVLSPDSPTPLREAAEHVFRQLAG